MFFIFDKIINTLNYSTMKLLKKLFLVLFLCTTGMSMPSAFGQAVEEGNIIIDVTYGFPNLFTSVLKATYIDGTTSLQEQVDIKSLGPIGFRFEYMVSDKLGVGAEVNHAATNLSYLENGYSYQLNNPRTRIMARIQYHFIDNDKVDAYIGGGAGYKLAKSSFESTDPDFTDQDIAGLPVAFRIGGGMRYFFTDNLGVNLELGLGGGGLIAAGISAKF